MKKRSQIQQGEQTGDRRGIRRWGRALITSLALLGAGLAQHATAAVTWQVQSDYFGAPGGSISQARSLRGLALAPDDASLYGGFIQGSTSGGIRNVLSGVLAVPGSDSAIIGNGMGFGSGVNPNGNYASNPYYGVGVLATRQTGGGAGANNQPKGVATDDRGYIYATLNSAANAVSQPWAVYSANVGAQVGLYVSTAASASQLAGICSYREGANYFVYISRNGPSAQIERWNVTVPSSAALDTTWGNGTGKINLRTLFADAYCNGLEADVDGTLYVSGGIVNLSTSRGDSVFQIPAAAGVSGDLSSVTRTDVNGAMDVAIFQDRIVVSQYLAGASTVALLLKSDLSLVETMTTGFAHSNTAADSGYSGIDVDSIGRIYVVDQIYVTATSYTPPATSFNMTPTPMSGIGSILFDRILISSALPDVEAPVITCPADQTVNNDPGLCSANVAVGMATATDDVDGTVATTGTRSDAQPLNAPYPVGTTIITWSATDSSMNTATCMQTIVVNDAEPPAVTCPANISTGNTPGMCGAILNPGMATATDNCDPTPSIIGTRSDSQPLNAPYPPGVTTISWAAFDDDANLANCFQTITVADTEAPGIVCPANVVASTSPGQCSAAVNYPAPTVTDNCPGVGAPVCSPPSGSILAKGTTMVTCSVQDASANPSSCVFSVTVNDSQAPSVSCPGNISVPASGPGGAVVTFSATASDNCDPVTPTCMPASGSTFPIGTTTVTCTATDTSANSGSCSFTVTVTAQSPRAAKTQVRDELVTLLGTISNSSDKSKLQDAINHLNKSLAAANWTDDSHPKKGSAGEKVFSEEKPVVTNLKALRNSNNSGIPAATLQGFINRLVAIDRALLTIAIQDAINRGGSPSKINAAQVHLNKGDNEAAADKPDKAIDEYKNGWKDATSA